MMNHFRIFLTLPFILLLACGGGGDPKPDPENPTTPTSILNINTSNTFQKIAGFGGADGIFTPTAYLNDTETEIAFGTEDGQLGLSIFRVKLPYDQNDWPLIANHAKNALAHGDVKILASPWSPPPALKSNGNGTSGHLLRENYPAYADHINSFIHFMTTEGVNVYAISPQNEPDYEVNYESCDWSSTAMRDFIKEQGGSNIKTKIAAPECFQFDQAYTRALLTDDDAVQNFEIVAGHIYGGGLEPFPLAEEKGKEIWMTEHLYNLNTGQSGAIPWEQRSDEDKWDETIQMLSDIHEALTYNWHAYIWWYTKRYYSFLGDGTEGTSTNTLLKRGYAYSHYSRFIRPGYQRVETQFTSPRDLKVTAYQGDGKTIIVIINDSTTPVSNISLTLNNETPSAMKLYKTSLNIDCEMTELTQENDLITFSINSSSVLTLVID